MFYVLGQVSNKKTFLTTWPKKRAPPPIPQKNYEKGGGVSTKKKNECLETSLTVTKWPSLDKRAQTQNQIISFSFGVLQLF